MQVSRLSLVLVAASVVLTGCSNDSPRVPPPVVVAFDDGWGQVFVADGDGSELRQVTPTMPVDDSSSERYANHPALSPDGMRLAYTRGGRFIEVVDRNNRSEVYSMPVGGGEITRLTHTYGVHPQFTPDGSRILYTRAISSTGEPVTDPSSSSGPEVASMSPDGTDQKRFTPRSITAQSPSVGGGL
jgi:TolB protein